VRWVAWIVALLFAAPVHAQVTGRVVDAESGDPVAEATVAAEGGRALTDSTGAFTLTAAPGRGSARVSRIGYEDREISWDLAAETVDVGTVELEPAELTLEALRVELDRVDRLADESAYSVARMDERALAHSASDNALDAISQRFGITTGNCPALAARMGTCRQVRGTATSVCLIVDESYIPGGVAALETYRPSDLGRVFSVSGGSAIVVYTRWFLELATRKRRWTPIPIQLQLTMHCGGL
jgi:hypothetical protein